MNKQFHITAIIYDKRGRIISIGRNQYLKTHPLQKKYAEKVGLEKKIYLHAEVDAIIRCRDLKLARKILITRFNGTGEPMNATPCKICQEAIRVAGIKIIEHT